MADNEKALEKMQAEIEALRAEKEALNESLTNAKTTGIISLKIPGSLKLKLASADGKEKEVKVTIADGRTKMRLRDGRLVDSAAFLGLANGKEVSEDVKAAFPAFAGLTKEDAIEHFTFLAGVGASVINIA